MPRNFYIYALVGLLGILNRDVKGQSATNGKSFLGSYWSTKPDTTVKRKFTSGGYISYGLKYVNFNPLHIAPWFNGISNQRRALSTEDYFGNPTNVLISLALTIDLDNYNNSSNFAHSFYGGVLVGHKFFSRANSDWLKFMTLSAGCVYDFTRICINNYNYNYGLSTYSYNYYLDNFLGRIQVTFDYPMGLYETNKNFLSTTLFTTVILKLGYDIPLGMGRWENPDQFGSGAVPRINMGGFYFSAGFSLESYRNKELFKKEMENQRAKKE
jgi:hypothetical protein